MRSILPVILISVMFLGACRMQPASESRPNFTVGGASPSECGPITEGTIETIGCLVGVVGHEHLTRIAEIRAHEMTSSEFYRVAAEEIAAGGGGDSSNDDIVIGNYSTDKPIFVEAFDLAQWHSDFFGVEKSESWHESGKRQMFHSLINFSVDDNNPGSLWTKEENCKAIRNVIRTQAEEGLKLIKAGRLKEGMRLIGSATHTIQDSFSRAHTVRSKVTDVDDGNFFKYRQWSLDRFCKYGKAVPGVCGHEMSHDFITELGPVGGPFKQEARAATDTTTAFLLYIHWILNSQMSLDAAMSDFFSGSSKFLEFAKRHYTEKQERMVVTVGTFNC